MHQLSFLREDTQVVTMALHLVIPPLLSMASLSDDFYYFVFLPHPTQLYLGCVSFIRKRPPVFPNLI